MAIIRPCADLRNSYNELSTICHQTQQPIYITKNGSHDLVLLSNEAFEQYEEERISRLISEQLDKKFADFESFQKDLMQTLNVALQDVAEGRFQPMEKALAEMEEKYGFSNK